MKQKNDVPSDNDMTMVTSAELMKRLKMNSTSFSELISSGNGPKYIRVGKHAVTGLRFLESEIERWIKQGGANYAD